MVNSQTILDQSVNPYPFVKNYALMEGYTDFSQLEASILQFYSNKCAQAIFFPTLEPYASDFSNNENFAPFIIQVEN